MTNFGMMVGWGMGYWWFGGPVILGLFIWLFVSILGRTSQNRFHNDTPINILKERLAKGEISEEVSDRMSTDLRY